MSDEFPLWRVTFSYESASEHVGARERKIYTVVAQNKGEAESKSFAHFSKTEVYDGLDLSDGFVRTTTTRIKKRRITLPQLTLEENQQQFSISPRLSADNSSIEYVIYELIGR